MADHQHSEDQAPAPAPRFGMLKYTLARVLLFAIVTGLLWLVGVRANTWVTFALGLAISGLISFFVLNRTRDNASRSLSGAFRRLNDRIDASARAEDDPPAGGPPTSA